MTASVEKITRIIKPGPFETCEAITHIGSDSRWWTVPEAIALIQSRQVTFFTTSPNGVVAIIWPYEVNGRWYLRTQSDGIPNNNLLSLPRAA